MKLTKSKIEEDIAGFKKRIAKARAALDALPGGYLPFKEHKKREKQRRKFEGEIEHVKQICIYAKQALDDMAFDSSDVPEPDFVS